MAIAYNHKLGIIVDADDGQLIAAMGDNATKEQGQGLVDAYNQSENFEQILRAAISLERQRIANWLATQRNDVPASGNEFAETLRVGVGIDWTAEEIIEKASIHH